MDTLDLERTLSWSTSSGKLAADKGAGLNIENNRGDLFYQN